MSPKERILEAIDLEEPDCVPLFDFLYENRSFENILEKKIISLTPEDYIRGHKALGLDMICIGAGAPQEWKDKYPEPHIKLDEWGVKWKVTPDFVALPWYLEGPIKNVEDLNEYEMPDPHAPGRLKNLEEVLKKVGEEIAVATPFPLGGPFSGACILTGYPFFLKSLIVSPSFAKKLLEMQTWFCLEIGKMYLDAGAEIIFINDDLGDVHGPLVSPTLFRKNVFPFLKDLTQHLKKRGAKILLHCDGNVNLIMDDLIGMGIDGFHPVERKAGMDIRLIKQKYGDGICLIGNVDASTLLPFGTFDEIREQVKECIEIAAPGGGYIFASDHSIHPGIPANRARFMFEAARRYRKYKL